MKRFLALPLALLLIAGCRSTQPIAPHAELWNLEALKQAPAATWINRTGLVQEVYYQGEPYRGKPTRVFAYLGRPDSGKGPFPAMVLVHGGGGKAFRQWAEHWAKRGYVALAMDTAGVGPDGPLPNGGPDQSDETKFRNFTDQDARDMWTYHAVCAVIRGTSLVASLPEVDPHRIGITGISWGGYLTCIVAGLDHRLRVAVPVYGCGFLGNNSYWKTRALAKMSLEARALWLQDFDPSQYLDGVECPILFLNGSNDFAYPLDSYRACYRLVPARFRNVSVVLDLPHGHIWSFQEVDAFVDSVLRGGVPLPRLGQMKIVGDKVSAKIIAPAPIKEAALRYTTDTCEWQKRHWETLGAEVRQGAISAQLPAKRPLVWFLSVTDERGLRVSSEHEELPVAGSGR